MRSASAPRRRCRRARLSRTGDETKERLGEQRGGDVAVLEREWRAQAIAVGEQNQRNLTLRQLEDQTGVRVLDHAELPHDLLAVIGLHEPSETERRRTAAVPHCIDRVSGEESVRQAVIETTEILGSRDDAYRPV